MTSRGSSYDRIRQIVTMDIDVELQPGDEAVLRSIIHELTDAEASTVLDDFFDVEPLTLAIYDEFLTRGSNWGSALRERLAKALFFCGFDTQAQNVLATLE